MKVNTDKALDIIEHHLTKNETDRDAMYEIRIAFEALKDFVKETEEHVRRSKPRNSPGR